MQIPLALCEGSAIGNAPGGAIARLSNSYIMILKQARHSSGNMTADRRADYARQYAKSGDFIAASDLARQALDLAPGHLPFMVMHAGYLEKAGDAAAAADAWRTILSTDSDDPYGAALKLAKLGRSPIPDRSPTAYVQSLFDDFAPRFDSMLVEKLSYCAPQLLASALSGFGPFAHVIDLGCGTGLMGERLRLQASFMEGLDLSPGMLKLAKAKGIYDHLAEADLATDFRDRCMRATVQADLAVAADVLIYIGDLALVFSHIESVLAPGGRFAFTVETHDGEGDYVLRQSLRFAHSADHVRRSLANAGFDLVSLHEAVLRQDAGEPINGLVVVANKTTVGIAVVERPIAADDSAAAHPGLH